MESKKYSYVLAKTTEGCLNKIIDGSKVKDLELN